ncbi:MAG: DUF4956 domain-containing protein [Sphingobacteriaceae bacterium]|nr:DUF4956 domain-containing protein [Sphingobacteriaceae bacterium]
MLATILLQIADESVVTSGFDALMKIGGKLGLRFLVDLASVFVLIRLVYFPIYKRRELFFTYFIFNIVIFLICFLLNKVDLSMGAAFGLFAVFSMLRYRTEDISMKDMTYLFLVIAMGLISAVTKIKGTEDYIECLFVGAINIVIILVAYLLESTMLMKKEGTKVIIYENINLISTDREAELIEDIKKRTGVNVHRITIQKIDFLRDSAQIKIFYFE